MMDKSLTTVNGLVSTKMSSELLIAIPVLLNSAVLQSLLITHTSQHILYDLNSRMITVFTKTTMHICPVATMLDGEGAYEHEW